MLTNLHTIKSPRRHHSHLSHTLLNGVGDLYAVLPPVTKLGARARRVLPSSAASRTPDSLAASEAASGVLAEEESAAPSGAPAQAPSGTRDRVDEHQQDGTVGVAPREQASAKEPKRSKRKAKSGKAAVALPGPTTSAEGGNTAVARSSAKSAKRANSANAGELAAAQLASWGAKRGKPGPAGRKSKPVKPTDPIVKNDTRKKK